MATEALPRRAAWRGLRAGVRRRLGWWRRLATPELSVVYDPRYEASVAGVPLDPLRGEKILASLDEEGFLGHGVLAEPRPASYQSLLRVHTEEYLQSLQDPGVLARILGVETPARGAEQALDLQRLMVGGTIQAFRRALRTGGVGVHLGGGFHHAFADRGQCFCVLNDVAVAVAQSRERGYAGRVLVVDLDLHDGNGTRSLFARDPTVHTYSIHNEDWGDREAVESTTIPVGPDVEDALYLDVLRTTLPPVFEDFRPDLVVYVAGTDVAADDLLGNWRLTAEGLLARDLFVAGLVRGRGPRLPLVVVLAGGYGPRAWRYSARFVSWLVAGRVVEPPPDEELTLKRYRRIGAARTAPRPATLRSRSSSSPPTTSWGSTPPWPSLLPTWDTSRGRGWSSSWSGTGCSSSSAREASGGCEWSSPTAKAWGTRCGSSARTGRRASCSGSCGWSGAGERCPASRS